MRLKQILGILVVTVLGTVGTSDASPKPLTVRSSVETALKNSPTIRQAREKLVSGEANVSLATAQVFPNLSAVISGDYRKDALTYAGAKFNGEPYNQYSADLRLAQPVFVPGLFAGFNIFRKDQVLNGLDLEIVTRNLTSSVIQGFYLVLLDRRTLDTLIETQTIQKESLATAEKRYRIGRGQLLDVLQAKTQLALLDPKIAQARKQILVDAASLATLLGDREAKEIQVEGKLATPALTEVQPKPPTGEVPLLPEYKKMLVSQERLQSERSATLGQYLPRVDVLGDYARNAYKKNDLFNNASGSWALTLRLTIPIFAGLSSVYQSRSYSSLEKQLEFQKAGLEDSLSFAQVRTSKDLEVAHQTTQSSASAFDLAKSSLNEARKNYQLATIDFLQFLQVQQAYLEAQSSLDLARYNYIVSLVNYYVASGLSLEELVGSFEEKSS